MSVKRYKLTRATKTHVWIINMAFGSCCRARQRGLSRRIPIEEFHEKWERLPQREVRRKLEAAPRAEFAESPAKPD